MITLSQDQENAMDRIIHFISDECTEKEMTLSGKSGAGKTTLLKHTLEELESRNTVTNLIMGTDTKVRQIHLTATTNQAAKVLSKVFDKKATTIHKLLGLVVFNNHSNGETITKKGKNTIHVNNHLIILDEASMVNEGLLKLIRELTIDCKILYVGDHKQLPPVKRKECPVFNQVTNGVKLTSIHRQAKQSAIKDLGEEFRQCIKSGKFPRITSNLPEIEQLTFQQFEEKLEEYFKEKDTREYKVLAYKNTTVNTYNAAIKSLHSNVTHHEIGDIVVTNNSILQMGHIIATDSLCKVTDVSQETEKFSILGRMIELDYKVKVFQPNKYEEAQAAIRSVQKEAKINSSLWKVYFELKETFADLRNIYSSTVHKAQGQTFDTVFIDLGDIGKCTRWYDTAKLLYVAITRASNKVYFYGSLPERYYNIGN